MTRFLAGILLLFATSGFSASWYVATNGLDVNAGTIGAPFATIMRAQSAAHFGDVVWLRGGTYFPTNITFYNTTNYPWNVINNMTNSGISYLAYSNELPVFDFSRVNFSPPTNRVTGFQVTGNNCVFKGFDVVGVPILYTTAGSQCECFRVNGGNQNRFEQLRMHDNHAIGFYLTDGASNLVLNCDAYRNWGLNANSIGNIDGFGFHSGHTNSVGNVIRGCRAWFNSDDGYDLINNRAMVLIDHCWAFFNGYSNYTFQATGGNANGFKAGGFGVSGGSYPIPPPRNRVQFCLSVHNGANGFYANFHPNGLEFINNTAYTNGTDYNFICIITNTARSFQIPGTNHLIRNNLGFQYWGTNSVTWLNTNYCDIAGNYFTLPVTVGTNDFMSLDESLLTLPRQPNGDLPNIAYAQLVSSSDLVDAGTNAGFAFIGAAPDLGAFEYGSQVPALGMSTGATNLVLVITNGLIGGTNFVVATTNLALPMSQWTRVATNTFDLNGNSRATNALPAAPGQTFYRVGLP